MWVKVPVDPQFVKSTRPACLVQTIVSLKCSLVPVKLTMNFRQLPTLKKRATALAMRLMWFEIEYYKMKWPVSVHHWTWFQWCYWEPPCRTTIAASLQHSILRSHHSSRLRGLDGFRPELGSSLKCLCGRHCDGIRVKLSVSIWHRWGRIQDDHTRLQWKSSWKATRHCSCTWIVASIENEYKMSQYQMEM